jgi:hypothetical protein
MPFKSEKQRKYLWANEPEIARDWTDTYGSKIHKADGGIMRRRYFSGAYGQGAGDRGGDPRASAAENRAAGRAEGPAWSPGTGGTQHIPTQPKKKVEPKGDGWISRTLGYLKNKQKKGIQGTIDRNKVLAMRKMGLTKGWNPFDDDVPEWAQGWSDEELNKIARTGPYLGSDIRRTGKQLESGSELLGRVSELKADPTQATHGRLFPGPDKPTDGGRGGGQIPWWLQQPAPVAAVDDTATASTDPIDLYRGSYRVDPRFLLAAEGGLIGSVGGISRPKYQEGNMVGAEMEGAEMEGAMMQSQEVIKELYDALIAQGLSPQEAMEKIKEIIASTQTQEPQSPMMGEEFPGQEFGRAPAAFGGMMDTYTGRRKYGLGSLNPFKLVKKAVKKVKELASSKFGKMALGYLATAGLANVMAPGAAQWGGGLGKQGWLRPGGIMKNLSRAWAGDPTKTVASGYKGLGAGTVSTAGQAPPITFMAGRGPQIPQHLINPTSLIKGGDSKVLKYMADNPMATILGGSLLAGATAEETDEVGGVEKGYNEDLAKWEKILAPYKGKYRVDPQFLLPGAAEGGRIGYKDAGEVLPEGLKAILERIRKMRVPTEEEEEFRLSPEMIEGGWRYPGSGQGVPHEREPAQEGGLMNLGGMEKDYRQEGGFVPLGGEEKADDVPARLSRNEFVFTADAVRNAGGGDIDRGAEVMENVMKNLEDGGKVSEESQGQGAQEMFETSERLSEVI